MNNRIEILKSQLDIAERMERGEASHQEIVSMFAALPPDTIEKIEAEIRKAGIPELPYLPRCLNRGSPEFHAAMLRLKQLRSSGKNEDRQEFIKVYLEMMRLAPPWWEAEMDTIFYKTFDIQPDYIGGDGQPLFSLECVSNGLGVSESEIMDAIHQAEESGIQITTNEKSFPIQ